MVKAKKSAVATDEMIIEAALSLAEEGHWDRLSLQEISDKASLSLPELQKHFASKAGILDAFTRQISQKVLGDLPAHPDEDDSPRDRLFETMMTRFEILQPYKGALKSILRNTRKQPAALLRHYPGLTQAMSQMLEASGIPSGGLIGIARIKGLSVVYGKAFAIWLRDDSADMSKTMASLDKDLKLAEKLEISISKSSFLRACSK